MLLAFIATAFSQAQIGYCSRYIDGYWGDWFPVSSYDTPRVEGTYGNFVIYTGSHPSRYCVKVCIHNFNDKIDKKEKKRRIKEELFYEYNGTIEFYLNDYDGNTTIEDWVAHWNGRMPAKYSHDRLTGKEAKKVTYPAKINIAPYKDNPTTYNVFFDKYGIAFSFK